MHAGQIACLGGLPDGDEGALIKIGRIDLRIHTPWLQSFYIYSNSGFCAATSSANNCEECETMRSEGGSSPRVSKDHTDVAA